VTYLDGDGVTVSRTWIDPEADLTDLAGEVTRTRADVLVVLAGSMDVRASTSRDQVELALQRIVDRTGARRVLVSSIPPVPRNAQQTADFNDYLARVAYQHDWSFVNAGATVVKDDCEYEPALGGPGPRLTHQGASVVGRSIRGILTTRTDLDPSE
jgi:hypothetical protein